jgi:hypothetical protein
LCCSSKSGHAGCLDKYLNEARFTLEDLDVKASKFKSGTLPFSQLFSDCSAEKENFFIASAKSGKVAASAAITQS